MMMSKMLPVAAILALALAGCGAKPASGTLVNTAYEPPVSADITITYQAFNSGGNPACTVPASPTCTSQTQCAQDQVLGGVPMYPPQSPLQKCTQAFTRIVGTLDAPNPNGGLYGLYFVGGPTIKGPQDGYIADFAAVDGKLVLNKTYADIDLSANHYTSVELRMLDYTIGSVPATAGKHPLSVNPVSAISIKGTFAGNTLHIELAGTNATGLHGRLYAKSANGTLAVAEEFGIIPGVQDITTDKPVGTYAEFHLHVGSSLLNLYKATVTVG